MDSDFAEVLVCNGNKPSVEFGSEEVVDKEEDEEETNMLLRTTVNGGIVEGKGPKSSRRKVQWNDLNGNKLVEVLEFQPSFILFGFVQRFKRLRGRFRRWVLNLGACNFWLGSTLLLPGWPKIKR
ncbi:uncharacterized protein LOC109703496 isoform X3 [Ananas comosus]|uniref:Uncharacterized protein LOC109703496 isoform X3 n=1 Tax=Ananas comosus TaxID=4615 RepID=A0A6P5E993_ANACO|nr:uncharacterized protein LOC109703496 isoform X3 [Ananas comosus]